MKTTDPTMERLLSERNERGEIPLNPYSKWDGAHWVLTMLAEIDYPPGDMSLAPLRDRVYGWLLSDARCQALSRRVDKQSPVRWCASIEGNAIWYSLKLGLADNRIDALVERLLAIQWPDGGWNCDVDGMGNTSSFHETIVPMRALALYAKVKGDARVRASVERSAEVFLSRSLFRRRRDGGVIDHSFVKIHFPCYWHYDFLFGLKVMSEAGFLSDPRCADALDLLESKRLPDGGWPAEAKYYTSNGPGRSLVDWGPTGKTLRNEFVTADALAVLHAAGRVGNGAPAL